MTRVTILFSFGLTCLAGCVSGGGRQAADASSEPTAAGPNRSAEAHSGLIMLNPDGPTRDEHTEWIDACLKEIHTIKPGSTRRDLLVLFTTEGGIYSRTWGHFVYRKCPYIKVDVEFKAADNDVSRMDTNDVIARISRPYLERTIAD